MSAMPVGLQSGPDRLGTDRVIAVSRTVGRDIQINGQVSPGKHMGGLANIFEKSPGSARLGTSPGWTKREETVTMFIFLVSAGIFLSGGA